MILMQQSWAAPGVQISNGVSNESGNRDGFGQLRQHLQQQRVTRISNLHAIQKADWNKNWKVGGIRGGQEFGQIMRRQVQSTEQF